MLSTDLCYVLHTRPYRETSIIAHLFTRDCGRFSGVHRGVRGRALGSPFKPFNLVQVGWTGRGDLKTLTSVEPLEYAALASRALYLGLYINELLLRLVHEYDPHPALFDHYHTVIGELQLSENIEPSLRRFEFFLLREIGYGLLLDTDADTGEPLLGTARYTFLPNVGFKHDDEGREGLYSFSGLELLAMARGEFETVGASAKRLVRLAMAPLLGGKPLKTRELFQNLPTNIGSRR